MNVVTHSESLHPFRCFCSFISPVIFSLCSSHIDFVTPTLPPRCRQYCCSPFPPKVAHTSPERTTTAFSTERDPQPSLLFSFSISVILSSSSAAQFSLLCFLFCSSIPLCAGVGVPPSPWPRALLRVISGIDQGVWSLTAALPLTSVKFVSSSFWEQGGREPFVSGCR